MAFYKWSKTKNKRYLLIAKSVKKDGVSTHEILAYLGTADTLLSKLRGDKNEA